MEKKSVIFKISLCLLIVACVFVSFMSSSVYAVEHTVSPYCIFNDEDLSIVVNNKTYNLNSEISAKPYVLITCDSNQLSVFYSNFELIEFKNNSGSYVVCTKNYYDNLSSRVMYHCTFDFRTSSYAISSASNYSSFSGRPNYNYSDSERVYGGSNRKLLYSNYDVYDNNGNMVHENNIKEEPETKISLSNIVTADMFPDLFIEIISLLPIVIIFIVLCISLRKGIAFLGGFFRRL